MNKKTMILVVDDDKAIRESLGRLLTRRGYAVDTAITAETALLALDAKNYDLVLTDLQMPGMDGLTLLGKIKQRSPHIPVIMLTAYASTETVVRALRSGVNDFITKPFQPRELLNIIKREVERHQQIAPPSFLTGVGCQPSRQQLDEIDRLLAQLRVEINARSILLIEGSGHVLGAKGYIEELNVSALAALVAGDFAATAGIASLIGEGDSFRLNYHEGKRYNAYSAQIIADVFLLIIFGQEVKLGAVIYYTKKSLAHFQQVLEQAQPAPAIQAPPQPPQAPPPTPQPQEVAIADVAPGLPEPPADPVQPEPAITDSAPSDKTVYTLEEIMSSGLLDENALSDLDARLANLWVDDTT